MKKCLQYQFSTGSFVQNREGSRKRAVCFCFYEWNGEKFVEREYKNISFRAEYGTVFYKYLNEYGMAIFVEKK